MSGPIVTVPNIFVNGTVAEAPDVNTDFQSLVDQVNGLFPLATSLGGTGSSVFSAFTVLSMQTFTTSGTYTPTAGTKYALVLLVGGGAGGRQESSGNFGGGGGGAGEAAIGIFSAATIGASQTVTIGVGGAATSNGGTTSLGSLLTALGGSTGLSGGIGGPGGMGGTGTGLHIQGGDGHDAALAISASQLFGGHGGASFFGGGGRAGTGLLDNGQVGKAYGSGGGGNGYSSSTFSNAGAGKGGVVVVIEFG